MKAELLTEPELQFGAGTHVDIRFGLKNYGPITFDDPAAPREIRLGFVGTPTTIQGVKDWLEASRKGIAAKESKKPNLFPAFPGFGADTCFRCEWISASKFERAISPRTFNELILKCPRNELATKAVDLFIDECRYLTENTTIDVLVCAPPQELFECLDTPLVDEQEAGNDRPAPTKIDFHDLLKARGLALRKPIQMVRPVTYDDTVKETSKTGKPRHLQDAATRAWNFHTALYYKAGGTPWRLVRNPSDFASCYIGVSFFRSLDKERVQTSVAQVFNERGEGMILKGGDAQICEEDQQHHLSRTDMAALICNAITAFHQEHKHMPARVVVHKTSSFNDVEKHGCDDALKSLNVASRDLLVVSESFTRLFREGVYPPLRGTFVNFDARHSILYTRGSIDFYMMYPGMYVPKSIELVCVDVEQPARALAQEILALTKMNWNNTQFDSALPITIKAARQVGAILKYVESSTPIQANYAFYM
jgi:hypothetical protein